MAVLLDDDKILIIGGCQNVTAVRKTYLYNVESDSLKPFEGGGLIDSDHFGRFGSQYAYRNNQLLAMGVCSIHCYSLEKRHWVTASEAFVKVA